MQKKLPNKFISIIILSLFAGGIVYATGMITEQTTSYKTMSTYELQEEVEKLSRQGELPYEMGQELMYRWSHQ